MKQVCNLWRNWDDINDSWDNLTNIMKWFSDNQDRLAKNAGPGHWNDPDMVSGSFWLNLEMFNLFPVTSRKLWVELCPITSPNDSLGYYGRSIDYVSGFT